MDLLSKHGIELRNRAPGNHKAKCPQCSHTRRNKADPCLSVLVEGSGAIKWHCHHCSWRGADDGEAPAERPVRQSRASRRADQAKRWRGQFSQGRW